MSSKDDFSLYDQNWPEVLFELGLPDHIFNRKHQPCPLCGGTDRFRFTNKHGRGDFICTHCGPGKNGHGNGYDLIQGYFGVDFSTALKMVKEKITNMPVERRVFSQEKHKDLEQVKTKLNRWWDQSQPLGENTPAYRYLISRVPRIESRFNLSGCSVLRYLPTMALYHDFGGRSKTDFRKVGTFPGLLSKVFNCEMKPIAVHRTYLTPDGRKNANLPHGEPARKCSDFIETDKGSVVPLMTIKGKVLIIAEGIETALSAFMLRDGTVPAWSALNAWGLEKFTPPPGIERVLIYADHDFPDEKGNQKGIQAAQKLQVKLFKSGIRSTIYIPQIAGQDWNDVWVNKCLAHAA